jgi:L-seryl-tRNA(Ser) seleniumtransferase
LHDLGGGAVQSPPAPGLPRLETAAASLAAGAHLVMFSGDKLLGGPQSGLLVGDRELIARCRAHPLARALRLDKLLLAALEATLRLHRDGRAHELPSLAALGASPAALAERAVRLQILLLGRGLQARVVSTEGEVGGGSLPLVRLESRAVLVAPPPGQGPQDLAAALRQGRLPLPAGLPAPLAEALAGYGFGNETPPVLGRLHDGGLLLDVRCLPDAALPSVAAAVAAAQAALGPPRQGDRTTTKSRSPRVDAAPGPISTTMEGEEEV